MPKQLHWMKVDIDDFLDGVIALDPRDGWVYWIICLLYARDGGPVKIEPAVLGRRCNMRPSSVSKSIERLLALGKLYEPRPGFLANRRVDKEVDEALTKSALAAKSAAARWKSGGSNPSNKSNLFDTDLLTGVSETQQKPLLDQPLPDANAMRTQSERNARAMPYTDTVTKQEPLEKNSARARIAKAMPDPEQEERPKKAATAPASKGARPPSDSVERFRKRLRERLDDPRLPDGERARIVEELNKGADRSKPSLKGAPGTTEYTDTEAELDDSV